VIDSSSTDDTGPLPVGWGLILLFPKNLITDDTERRPQYLNTSIVVMDYTRCLRNFYRYAGNSLVKPLADQPCFDCFCPSTAPQRASFFAHFARQFNYPAQSHIRSIDDTKTQGAYTFFCSNSCAAYLNSALDEIGGFPAVLFGEDSIVTAKLCIAIIALLT